MQPEREILMGLKAGHLKEKRDGGVRKNREMNVFRVRLRPDLFDVHFARKVKVFRSGAQDSCFAERQWGAPRRSGTQHSVRE